MAMATGNVRQFATLGMFIIDEFSFLDEQGNPTGKSLPPQIGGGGTYASIGARIWLPPSQLGMIIDRGSDFPAHIQRALDTYGPEMWLFRDHANRTTRARNSYLGDHRNFEYITPRIRVTPRDLAGTALATPRTLHFMCSPARALTIVREVEEVDRWKPTSIYEPIPDRCVPAELPALVKVLPSISILSPNAEEALTLLSMPLPPTKASVEIAAARFLDMGVSDGGDGAVIIRSGEMGAYVSTRARGGEWVDAYWTSVDASKVVDVTGAGNSFLGGLAAGLQLARDVYQATLCATISASFVIEQEGLPLLTRESGSGSEKWNGDTPQHRLEKLQLRRGGSIQ